MENKLQTRVLSSLAKVFPNRIYGKKTQSCNAAQGQSISFQIAYRYPGFIYRPREFRIKVISPLEKYLSFYKVGNVVAEFTAYPNRRDKNYICTQPGLYPDPLYPMENRCVCAATGIWRSLWVSVDIFEDIHPGKYPIYIEFYDVDNVLAAKCKYEITVHNAKLPASKLLYTQWFHCDCIADAHHVEIFSEDHWCLIDKYMELAAKHGMNMILTPIVTPPLDTAVGGERPTVQLVEIEKHGDRYSFDFTRLKRFAKMALSYGIHNFEINHFFTQWGACFAPKVVARENGTLKHIFGWDTVANDAQYVSFLGQLIPAVINAFAQMGVTKSQLWFHVSDEPHKEHLEQYRISKNVLYPLIEGCHHIDALSDYDYYREGLVETPVVAIDHIEPFLEAGASDIWCYNCCAQCVNVSNRFLSMPSARNRIIGVQMYKYGIKGFLHWGYNFYYSYLSKRKIDPFTVTDGDVTYPAGDPFSVYPYGNTVIPSLRQKVFANALEDVRLLQLLEEKIGKDRVIQELDALAGGKITFSEYPKDETFFTDLYERIFQLLES